MAKASGVLLIIVVIVAALAVGAYYYFPNLLGSTSKPTVQVPAAVPDDSVAAGPITTVSASSISIRKQDSTVTSFKIATTTKINAATDNGAAEPKSVKDLSVGMHVLITPMSSDTSTALSVVILPTPPQP